MKHYDDENALFIPSRKYIERAKLKLRLLKLWETYHEIERRGKSGRERNKSGKFIKVIKTAVLVSIILLSYRITYAGNWPKIKFWPVIKAWPVIKLAFPAYASKHVPALNELAQGHANYMASVRVQGHQGWESGRFMASLTVGYSTASEICAESWPEQVNLPEIDLWFEAARCWRDYSPNGHWTVASVQHAGIGIGLARGSNNVWYMCVIACD
jgi:hypothetical protein